ncbi:hypothetical protein DSO57_1000041 [Entomophthora muscae]|uniref:Uncharacterized protein n=1 Tax=Entomophthora muscae TaxID=34485 RepID=A0ACC2SME8_9FUNG|nr:hypothetical protein DSO57_1000041 [Entomophthora muscae]
MENPFGSLKQYLACDLQELSAEPTKLQKKLLQLDSDKAKVLATNYSLAIDSRLALDDSVPLVETLKSCLSSELGRNIESSESELKSVRETWGQLDEKKAQLNAIRQYSNHLQDLCDLPKLASALISLKNFQGALDIAKRVRRLLNSYKETKVLETDGSLLDMINLGVEAELEKMVGELIRGLKEDTLKLPECIQSLDFLAQTEWFPNQHLQFIFLSSRLASFESRLSITPKMEPSKRRTLAAYNDDPGRQLKRQLDLTLNFASELTYFYRACFPHSVGMESSRSLYYSVMHTKLVRPLIDNFKKKLPQVSQPSLIASLLNQSMFVGASLANVGLDLRQLLAPIFEQCILESFSQQFFAASKPLSQGFKSSLRVRRDLASVPTEASRSFTDSPGPLYESLLERLLKQDFSPPSELKHFAPLAQYTNDMLHHFNSLRTLAVLTLGRSMLANLLECLKEVGGLLLTIKPSKDSSQTIEFESWMYVTQSLFLDTLLPYLGATMILAIFGGIHVFTVSDAATQPRETIETLLQIQEFRKLFEN